MTATEIFALTGFLLAAWSVVANDSIQTLGTFLYSNAQRPWWILWLYASSLLIVVMVFGYLQGDAAFGRLDRLPYPETGIQWWHTLPPLALALLTRYGIPVSTTFLVLSTFALTGGDATEGVMLKMLIKSGLGYVVALLAGGAVWIIVARSWESRIAADASRRPAAGWIVTQWCTTAFLWSQWLMQDLANIMVYLPRGDDASLVMAGLVMIAMLACIFYTQGGKIQEIVRRKTNASDIRAATLIDLIFGLVLLIFKETSNIPMSTTWVFLGLLAGRETAISLMTGLRSRRAAAHDVCMDAGRAIFGLTISVALALVLPLIAMSG